MASADDIRIIFEKYYIANVDTRIFGQKSFYSSLFVRSGRFRWRGLVDNLLCVAIVRLLLVSRGVDCSELYDDRGDSSV